MAFLLISILLNVVALAVLQEHDILRSNYKTIVLHRNYSANITVTVDTNKEYIILFPHSHSKYPYTVYTWSEKADSNYPVFVMVRQQKETRSWKIPLLVRSRKRTLKFYNISRTLCHNNITKVSQMSRYDWYSKDVKSNGILKRLSMSISTTSEIATPVTIRVEEQGQFFVEENQNYSFTISPSEPRFFYYKYPDKVPTNFLNTVILEVDSQDDTCLTVSIQNASCPVFDLNEDIAYEGKYETVDTRGGIIINEKDFPNGFFVVFVAKGDDFDCIQKSSMFFSNSLRVNKPLNRSSMVSFKIRPNISQSEYWVASLSTLLAIAVFYFLFIAGSCGLYCWQNQRIRQEAATLTTNDDLQNLIIDEESETEAQNLPSTSGTIHVIAGENLCPEQEGQIADINLSGSVLFHSCASNSIVAEIPSSNRLVEIDHKLRSSSLCLTDLATKRPTEFHKESCNYFWQVITVGIFYAVPVMQLAITQQKILNETGNLDTCYYNFLCAHPLGVFSDFNHVFSNVAYLAAGILFFLNTFHKHKRGVHRENCGIPQHYGLYYAMAAALFMEGVLSACYHICPSQSNFQFDTSFMYVMAVLSIVKLYQNRHPDINATSYATFTILAVALLIVLAGILDGSLVVWILFIVTYTIACLYLSVHVYYLHNPVRGIALFNESRRGIGFWQAVKPIKRARFILLMLTAIINIMLACLGLFCYVKSVDFGTFFLILLMGNAFLYTILYIVMKKISGEKISKQAIIYFLLAGGTWGGASYFFIMISSEWKVPAAKSRERNTPCILLNFYDYHDVWHLLSAAALFFSFMLLSSLDDELVDVPRDNIAVF